MRRSAGWQLINDRIFVIARVLADGSESAGLVLRSSRQDASRARVVEFLAVTDFFYVELNEAPDPGNVCHAPDSNQEGGLTMSDTLLPRHLAHPVVGARHDLRKLGVDPLLVPVGLIEVLGPLQSRTR